MRVEGSVRRLSAEVAGWWARAGGCGMLGGTVCVSMCREWGGA